MFVFTNMNVVPLVLFCFIFCFILYYFSLIICWIMGQLSLVIMKYRLILCNSACREASLSKYQAIFRAIIYTRVIIRKPVIHTSCLVALVRFTQFTATILSFIPILPSIAAAPFGLIVFTKIPPKSGPPWKEFNNQYYIFLSGFL